MKVHEKSNSLVVRLNDGEDFLVELNKVLSNYHILEAWIRGFGYASVIEYGQLEKKDPIFFKKNRVEKIVTISTLTALVDNDQTIINFNGMSHDGSVHIGRMFSMTVAHEFEVIVEILKTE